MTVVKTYLLIDLENRQPEPDHVAAWIGRTGEAWIFYGEQQLGLLPKYWEIGNQVSIVPISKAGRNSLDFLLVLYLGYLVAKSRKKARYVIVAADKDYDSAIDHARAEGVDVVRLSELPMEASPSSRAVSQLKKGTAVIGKVAPAIATGQTQRAVGAPDLLPSRKAKTTSAVYAGTLQDIRGPNRPRDLEALRSRIQSRAGGAANPKTVSDVLARLETTDVIRMMNGEVVYLPRRPTSPPDR